MKRKNFQHTSHSTTFPVGRKLQIGGRGITGSTQKPNQRNCESVSISSPFFQLKAWKQSLNNAQANDSSLDCCFRHSPGNILQPSGSCKVNKKLLSFKSVKTFIAALTLLIWHMQQRTYVEAQSLGHFIEKWFIDVDGRQSIVFWSKTSCEN